MAKETRDELLTWWTRYVLNLMMDMFEPDSE